MIKSYSTRSIGYMRKPLKSEKLFLDELMKTAQHLKASTRGLSLGETIAIIRTHLGMSQTILARRAKVPQSTISRIEQSHAEPNLTTLHKILKALSCELILVPMLIEPIETIRRKQAHLQAEKKIRYLQGTMSLEKQEPEQKILDELLKDKEDELLRSSGNKLWKK